LFVHAEHAQAASEEEMLQHLQHLQTDRDLNFAETNATERALELQKLERDVTDIDDLIRDVGVLVQTQGEQMGEGGKGVELDLANTRAVARKAAIETAKAGKSRAKRRSVEGGASAAAVGGVVGIVGGPVGMAAGAAFGAMLGGWVGKKWGKREIEDIDAGLSRLERL
jgi:phage tail tape-measure protein